MKAVANRSVPPRFILLSTGGTAVAWLKGEGVGDLAGAGAATEVGEGVDAADATTEAIVDGAETGVTEVDCAGAQAVKANVDASIALARPIHRLRNLLTLDIRPPNSCIL